MLLISMFFLIVCVMSLIMVPWVLGRQSKHSKRASIPEDKLSGFLYIIKPLLRAYAHHLEHKIKPQVLDEVMLKLQMAGLIYSVSPLEFFVLKRLSIFASLAFAALAIYVGDLQGYQKIVITIIVSVVVGFYYPDIWLKDKILYRQKKIEKDFPFFLDLLVLMMRAGLPFSGAVQQGIVKMSDGPLRGELNRFQRDIRTGKSRADSLDLFAKRINIPAVTNFVAAIIQAEDTGGSITNVLSIQAKQRRKERFLKAEKKANEAPVKMLLPLVGLLFPITFIIIGIPIVVQFMDSGLVDKVMN